MDAYPGFDAPLRELALSSAQSLAYDVEGRQRVPDALRFFILVWQTSPTGPCRDKAAELLAAKCDAETWERLSGNQGGMPVSLRDFYYDEEKQSVRFFFAILAGNAVLYEQPTLELYQRDASGKPLNRSEQPLPLYYPKVDWSKGYNRWNGFASVE
jgi:hypothetical protein